MTEFYGSHPRVTPTRDKAISAESNRKRRSIHRIEEGIVIVCKSKESCREKGAVENVREAHKSPMRK